MTNFLLKLFFKKEPDYTDPAVRNKVGKLAGVVGIVCNVLLCTVKLISGFLSGSVSILADAVNNLSDAASSLITLLGFYIARRPADATHPYGHARIEYISGLVVSFLILLVGAELFESSVRRIIHPGIVDFTSLTFGILLGSILLKMWLSRFFSVLSRKIESEALEATFLDSRNDFISTAAVLVSCLLGKYFHLQIDGYVGVIMACIIFWSGIQIARTTVSSLLGKRADPEFIDTLTKLVLSHDKIMGVHDVLVHDYGPGQCFASLHAEVDAREDPLLCHDIIDDIECDALVRLNTHLVIHYDPVVTDDPEWNNMQAIVEEIIQGMEPGLSIHDFRIVHCDGTSKLAFDLAVPYNYSLDKYRIKLKVYEGLAARGKAYPVVIHFDSV